MCYHLLLAYNFSQAMGHVEEKCKEHAPFRLSGCFVEAIFITRHCTHSLLFTSHRTAIIGLSKHLKALFLHWPSFRFSSSYLCPAGLIDGSRVQLFRVSALCQLNQRGEGTEVEQVSLWLDPVGKLLPRWGGFKRTLRDNSQTLVSDKSPVWDGSESEHVSQRSCSCSPARPFWKQLHFSSPHCERTKIFTLGCS